MIVPALLALCVVAGGCSSKDRQAVSGATSTSASTPATDGTPPGSSGPTTASTTPAPTTTAPASTSTVPASTLPVVAAGWTPVDPVTVGDNLAPPCCGSNWSGTKSPPLPAAGAPLADGEYSATFTWGADPTAPLHLAVQRFEQCTALPASACEPGAAAFDPTELGVDVSSTYPLTVPLDNHVRVVLTGFTGFDATGPATSEANGSDFAQFAAALDTSFRDVLTARVAKGEQPDAVVADVRAHPAGGFGPAKDDAIGSLAYTQGSAPPLLFQAPFGFTGNPADARGVDGLVLASIHVKHGQLSLVFYGGFYS
jgi:hypothetical protein